MKTFSTKQDCDLKSYIDLKTYSMEFLDYIVHVPPIRKIINAKSKIA